MIYLIHGNDEIKSRQKYNDLLDSLLAKNPTASLFVLNGDNWRIDRFEELIKGQGLFYQKFIVGCDNLLDAAPEKRGQVEASLSLLATVATSANIFIFLENRLAVESLATIKTLAGKTQEFAQTATAGRSGYSEFNIYTLADAFAARNKNRAWALYHEALGRGLAPEEIFWKLVWQTNNLWLAKQTADSAKLGWKPFVLAKNKAAAKAWSAGELSRYSAAFSDLYHEAYLGTDEFDFGLEKIILSV